jgi:hypothetical protein
LAQIAPGSTRAVRLIGDGRGKGSGGRVPRGWRRRRRWRRRSRIRRRGRAAPASAGATPPRRLLLPLRHASADDGFWGGGRRARARRSGVAVPWRRQRRTRWLGLGAASRSGAERRGAGRDPVEGTKKKLAQCVEAAADAACVGLHVGEGRRRIGEPRTRERER